MEIYLVEFLKLKVLDRSESFQAKAKEIVAEVKQIFVAFKLKNFEQLIEGTSSRDYYLAQYCTQQGYMLHSIKKYLRSSNKFVTFLVLRKKEHKHNIENEHLILLQQILIKQSGKYTKASAKRLFQHQIEDHDLLIDEKQIKQYKESRYYLEPM